MVTIKRSGHKSIQFTIFGRRRHGGSEHGTEVIHCHPYNMEERRARSITAIRQRPSAGLSRAPQRYLTYQLRCWQPFVPAEILLPAVPWEHSTPIPRSRVAPSSNPSTGTPEPLHRQVRWAEASSCAQTRARATVGGRRSTIRLYRHL